MSHILYFIAHMLISWSVQVYPDALRSYRWGACSAAVKEVYARSNRPDKVDISSDLDAVCDDLYGTYAP